jgi:hypothetical protein
MNQTGTNATAMDTGATFGQANVLSNNMNNSKTKTNYDLSNKSQLRPELQCDEGRGLNSSLYSLSTILFLNVSFFGKKGI